MRDKKSCHHHEYFYKEMFLQINHDYYIDVPLHYTKQNSTESRKKLTQEFEKYNTSQTKK